MFYHRRPVIGLTVADTPAEARADTVGDAPVVRFHEWNQRPLVDLRQFLLSGDDRFVITTDRYLDDVRDELPEGVSVVQESTFFLKDDKLLVLGWSTSRVRTASVEHSSHR